MKRKKWIGKAGGGALKERGEEKVPNF